MPRAFSFVECADCLETVGVCGNGRGGMVKKCTNGPSKNIHPKPKNIFLKTSGEKAEKSGVISVESGNKLDISCGFENILHILPLLQKGATPKDVTPKPKNIFLAI